ncbi:MAG: hypothetical protein JWN00_6002 [Actinomycetia bacterium]|nr:hypothetical protein [Actinomycetes bacterium]
MTPEDQQVIIGLTFVPQKGRKNTPEDVLCHFGATDGIALGLRLLRDAVERKDGLEVGLALYVCGTFGLTMDHLELFVELASADWHRSHEDVANGLEALRTSAAVNALYHLAWWIPDYLDWDENRGLARKAIWGLGKTPGPEAEQALRRLLDEPDEIVRENAKKQLARRDQL